MNSFSSITLYRYCLWNDLFSTELSSKGLVIPKSVKYVNTEDVNARVTF